MWVQSRTGQLDPIPHAWVTAAEAAFDTSATDRPTERSMKFGTDHFPLVTDTRWAPNNYKSGYNFLQLVVNPT